MRAAATIRRGPGRCQPPDGHQDRSHTATITVFSGHAEMRWSAIREERGALGPELVDRRAVLDVLDEGAERRGARAVRGHAGHEPGHRSLAFGTIQVAGEHPLTAKPEPARLLDGQVPAFGSSLVMVDDDLLSAVERDVAV